MRSLEHLIGSQRSERPFVPPGASGDRLNVLNAAYVVAPSDNRRQFLTFFATPTTITYGAPSAYGETFFNEWINVGTRGVALNLNGTVRIVYPNQRAYIYVQAGAWIFTQVNRARLTAAATMFVRTDGNNSNDGLANDAAGAFAGIQNGIDAFADAFDTNAFAAKVQVGAGAYAQAINMREVVGLSQPSGSTVTHKLRITGDTATPGNVIINPAATAFTAVNVKTTWLIEGFQINAGGAGSGMEADFGSNIYFNAIDFHGAGGGVDVIGLYGSKVEALGNFTISHGGALHTLVALQAQYLLTPGITVTLTGTPAYSSAFAAAQRTGVAVFAGVTFTGGATGVRYLCDNAGGIDVAGAGTTFLPGSLAGTAAAPGWYN